MNEDTRPPSLVLEECSPHEAVLSQCGCHAKESTNDGVSGYIVEPSGERFVLSPDGAASVPEPWGLINVNDPDPPELPEGLFIGE